MNLINIENITKYYTDTPLFEQASFTVDESEKIGIIGINGTGKTTLLKMLVGMEEPDSGTVTRANNIVVRYLPQTPDFNGISQFLRPLWREIVPTKTSGLLKVMPRQCCKN